MRLNEVTIPDCSASSSAAHGCPVGANAAELHHDTAIGGDRGWVFFPTGKYVQVRAAYDWFPSILSNDKVQTEILIAPWNGSSRSLATPLPSAQPLSSAQPPLLLLTHRAV
jgi:hypothetical protein